MGSKPQLLAGIDVGTTKICTTVARLEDGGIEILGTGWAPSQGLQRGIVVSLEKTIESVKASVAAAEKESQTVVESAYVSVGGHYLRGFNCDGSTEVHSRTGEITVEDIHRAVTDAKAIEIPEDYQVIHVLTQDFTVDGQPGIINPLGMQGRELSVSLHLILHASAVVRNIINAVNKAGVLVDGVVMQQLASAEAVLSPDEKDLGTVVVDIGGGTTDVAIYSRGCIWFSKVLPLGGDRITRDIALDLRTPLEEAEQLKCRTATTFPESVAPEELVEVSDVGSGRRRNVSRQQLCEIVQKGCQEILEGVAAITRTVAQQSDLITGVVLTGGGSLLDGVVERAENLLGLPIRVGYPVNVVPHNSPAFHPGYATALGLLSYAKDIQTQIVGDAPESALGARPRGRTERMKNWLLEKIS